MTNDDGVSHISYVNLNPYEVSEVSEIFLWYNSFRFQFKHDNEMKEAVFPIEKGFESSTFEKAKQVKEWLAEIVINRFKAQHKVLKLKKEANNNGKKI